MEHKNNMENRFQISETVSDSPQAVQAFTAGLEKIEKQAGWEIEKRSDYLPQKDPHFEVIDQSSWVFVLYEDLENGIDLDSQYRAALRLKQKLVCIVSAEKGLSRRECLIWYEYPQFKRSIVDGKLRLVIHCRCRWAGDVNE